MLSSLPLLELDVQSLAHDGRAVCRDGQRVVFVNGGLPGQRVRVRLTQEKKRFAEGRCEAVLRPAPDAVPAPCVHAGECGGCPLQEMPAEQQLIWKGRILEQALLRIGRLPHVPLEPVQPSPQAWGYRNKMEFAFAPPARSGQPLLRLGLRGRASHEVVDVSRCLLMPPQAMDILRCLRELTTATGLAAWQPAGGAQAAEGTLPPDDKTPAPCAHAMEAGAKAHGRPPADAAPTQQDEGAAPPAGTGFWRHAVLRMPRAAGADGRPQVLVCCITAPGDRSQRDAVAQLGRTLMQRMPAVTGFVHEERAASVMLAQGQRTILRLGQCVLREQLGGREFLLDHGSFFQVNSAAAELLCATATSMAALTGTEHLWDLYCGVGAPGLCMAAMARSLHGVEFSPAAVDMARRNAHAAGYSHCHYVPGDARLAPRRWPQPHVALADPPRAGLHPDAARLLLRAAPQRIVYISCNPATLARDVALMGRDYAVERVVPVDLFPQTPHVESVALLVRKAGRPDTFRAKSR